MEKVSEVPEEEDNDDINAVEKWVTNPNRTLTARILCCGVLATFPIFNVAGKISFWMQGNVTAFRSMSVVKLSPINWTIVSELFLLNKRRKIGIIRVDTMEEENKFDVHPIANKASNVAWCSSVYDGLFSMTTNEEEEVEEGEEEGHKEVK